MHLKVALTGDRPTGKLHLGHYVGSLLKRIELQSTHKQFIMIADLQSLTDHAHLALQLSGNIIEVLLDYLSIGINPEQNVIFCQSAIPQLSELTLYYLNLVTVARLNRNPTVRAEIVQKRYVDAIPAGFLIYPVSQAADITAFKATVVAVGDDQLPVIEQTNEIVRTFNRYYGNTLTETSALLSNNTRLVGIDGQQKMSKSLNNAIYLSDDTDIIKRKVWSMFTDPLHIKVSDPGSLDNNVVFQYLEVFASDQVYLQDLKDNYVAGGLADTVVKQYLFEILESIIAPIRTKRQLFAQDHNYLHAILAAGAELAQHTAANTLAEVRTAMGIYPVNLC